jgi:molybdopterin biosynthesis enzyme
MGYEYNYGMDEHIEKYFKYTSPDEVLERILRNSRLSPRVIDVSVHESLGYVLAEDIVSPIPMPTDNVAHFDGYAVRSSDTLKASMINPLRLKVIGRIDSIREHDLDIKDGEAVYVVTGAKIPKNADAVIPVERVRLRGEYIEILESIKRGEHVTFRGADIEGGEIIQRKGDIVRPQTIRYLLDTGRYRVKVYDKPRVALIGVGDELTSNIEEAKGKKLETSSIMISYYVKEFGGIPIRFEAVPDSPDQIIEAVKNSLRENDICVTIGGVSLGARDLCWITLSKVPESIPIARGLRVQPGRATSIVLIDGKPVIMLPGHIQSTVSGTINILVPLISYMQGLPIKDLFPKVCAEIGEDLTTREYISFTRIRFVKLVKNRDGFIAKPILGDSSMIRPLIASNGFIKIPEKVEKIIKGSKLDVYMLSWSELLYLFSKYNEQAGPS